MFRNATDFCVLIFYPATLANSVMSCSHFLAAYLEFSMFSIMSSMNGGNLISLFLIWIYTFLMIAMVRTFNAMFTMLKKKKVVRGDVLVMFLIIEEIVQLFTND